MVCKDCSHLFMKHDEVGCKHAGCECKTTQQMIMGEPPSLISLIYFPQRSSEYWQNKAIKIGQIKIEIENSKIVIVPEKSFSKVYENTEPDRIFGIYLIHRTKHSFGKAQ